MKIPREAKKVFDGVIFDVYQWEQKLYDGSSAIFEALKRPDTVQIIPVVGNKILIASEEQPHYARKNSFLGGRIEEGEDPLTSAKREFLEETGMEAGNWELYKMYPVGGKIDWNLFYYIARDCRKVRDPHLDAGEKIDIQEVTFDEFVNLVTTEGFDSIGFANDLLRMRVNGDVSKFKKILFKRS